MSDPIENSACLLFSCPDKTGIIARIVSFFTEREISISRFEEYTDAGLFFARLEWKVQPGRLDHVGVNQLFQPVADDLNGQFQFHFFSDTQKLGLFVSHEPHALIEALNKYEAGDFPNTQIVFVIGNRESIRGLVARHGIPFYFVKTWKDPAKHEPQQLEIVRQHQPDLIGLARYMKVVTEDFIDNTGCPIVNIHHSFLPSFVGAKPYEMAYQRGVKLIGATSHYVTPELDQGPIIEQGVIRVQPGFSVAEMKKIGRDIEKQVFATALSKALHHKTITYQNRTIVFA